MPSNEGHIHWSGSADETVSFLEQELWLTSEASNMTGPTSDPIGTVRIKAVGFQSAGLALPSDAWQPVPGTDPILEARMDGNYAIGYIRLRAA